MASEWNRAVRMAQSVIRQSAAALPQDVGNRTPQTHPDRSGMLRAANVLDALIEQEEESDERD